MFKKDDYIVCLKKPNGILNFVKPNYIFKQKEEDDVIYTDNCLDGTSVRCSDLKFKDKDDTWRYAIPEEVAEYEKLGKPYDVTTLQQKDPLEGRYLKVVKNDSIKHYPCRIGDYLKYVGKNKTGQEFWGAYNSNFKNDSTDNSRYYGTNAHKMYHFELMPEGFAPEESKAYDYEVVHCTTQEELSYVKEKCNLQYGHRNPYYENTGICINTQRLFDGYTSISNWKELKCNAKIYSFKEWCDKFGHTMEKDKPFKPGDKLVGKSRMGTDITIAGNHLGALKEYFIADEIQYNTDGYEIKLYAKGSFWGCNLNDISLYQEKSMNTELTSLPERWCIKRTSEICDILSKQFKVNREDSVFGSKWNYVGFDNSGYTNGLNAANKPAQFSNSGATEITFDQFKKWVLKEEPMNNFEVGKWYKNLGSARNRYGKLCDNVTKDIFPCKEYITEEGEYRSNGSSFVFFKKATLLENLSEIQKYLPNGHPDKQENLVGRYLKALVDYPEHIGNLKKGEYAKINFIDGQSGTTEKLDDYCWNFNISKIGTLWELMPVGFNPNTTPKIPIDSSSTLHKSMEEIQEICKVKYPVGSVIRSTGGSGSTLLNDSYLYSIHGDEIWCHSGAGLLYSREDAREKWAEVIKLPESKNISKFDLVPGITYVGYWAKYEIIFQPLRGSLEDCYYIGTSGDFKRGPCCTAEGHGINFRLATPEEEQKLLHFINPQKQESYEKQLETPITKSTQRNNYEITEPIISKQRKHKPKLIVAKLEEAIL